MTSLIHFTYISSNHQMQKKNIMRISWSSVLCFIIMKQAMQRSWFLKCRFLKTDQFASFNIVLKENKQDKQIKDLWAQRKGGYSIPSHFPVRFPQQITRALLHFLLIIVIKQPLKAHFRYILEDNPMFITKVTYYLIYRICTFIFIIEKN